MEIPEKADENLCEIVGKIGKHVNYNVDEDSIETITRVPTKLDKKPKNIIVRFKSKSVRDNFLMAVKAKRIQQGGKAGFKLESIANQFYINEHLTTRNKILFKSARTIAREKHFKFVWVQGGHILVRKDETSQILKIQAEMDLNKLR